jgi:hypothetical protein
MSAGLPPVKDKHVADGIALRTPTIHRDGQRASVR